MSRTDGFGGFRGLLVQRLPVVVACWPQAGAQCSGVGGWERGWRRWGVSGVVMVVLCPWDLGAPRRGRSSSLGQAGMRKHRNAEN